VLNGWAGGAWQAMADGKIRAMWPETHPNLYPDSQPCVRKTFSASFVPQPEENHTPKHVYIIANESGSSIIHPCSWVNFSTGRRNLKRNIRYYKSDIIGGWFQVNQWHRGILIYTNHIGRIVNGTGKMGLTSLRDSFICTFCFSLFGFFTVLVVSLVFTKSTSFCVIRRNYK